MENKTRLYFNKFDYFLLLTSAAASIAISFYLSFHKFTVDEANLGEPIAKIVDVENSVRRKPSVLSFWLDLADDDFVYANDKIFTDNKSQMKIVFNDGAEVDVGENALLVLQSGEDSSVELNLEQGLIKGSAGYGKIKIKSQGVTSELEKGSVVEFKKGKEGQLSVAALKGNVTVETLDGKSSVAEGDYVKQSKTGLDMKTYSYSLVSPEVGKKLYVKSADKVSFKIKGEKSPDAFLSIYREQELIKTIALDSMNLEVALDEGSYSYKITNKSSDSNLSLEKSFKIIDISPTQTLSPVDGESISFVGKVNKGNYQARGNVRLDWKKQKAISYRVTIARDREFKKLWLDRTVKSNSLSIVGVFEGSYYWRVNSKFEGGRESEWTKISSFSLKEKAIPPAPRLNEPANGQAYTVSDGDRKVLVSWKPGVDSKYYDLRFSKNKKFPTDSTESYRSNTENYTYFPSGTGTFYLQIRSAGIDGRKTDWGSTVYFIVSEEKLDLPLEAPSRLSSNIDKSSAVVIKWNKIDKALAYQVQISVDNKFTKLVANQKSKANKIRLAKMKKKKYFFRVAAIDSKAKIGAWSQPEIFDLREKNNEKDVPLAANFDTPPAGAIAATGVAGAIGLAGAGAGKTTEGGGFFSGLFNLGGESSEQSKLSAKKAEDIEKEKKLAEEKFKKEEAKKELAQAQAKEQEEKKAKELKLAQDKKALESIKIKSPSKDALYVLKKKSRKIDFKYSGITSGTFLLAETEDLAGAKEVKIDASGIVSNTFNKVGTYYWTIAHKGVKAATRKLNLSPPRPQGLLPRANAKLSYIKKKPNVVFRWKSYHKPKELNLVISKNKAMTQIVVKKQVTGNSLELMGELSKGIYFWRVDASYDGVPDRNSQVRKITIKKTDDSLAPPDLAHPVNGSSNYYSKTPIPSEFKWSPVKNSNVYEIQVSKEKNFAKVSSDLTFKASHFFTLTAGNYYWRIRTYNRRNIPGKWSPVQMFYVKKQSNPITLDDPSNKEVFDSEMVKFSWDKVEGQSKYKLYIITKIKSFSSPTILKDVQGDEIKLDLPEAGNYYWYVTAGEGKDKYNSEIREFKIDLGDF